ncbi:hypothetical protein TcWFU_004824 [Taenia crassiceps]|uniref:Uncharacterized protein n=1 Tax=Taenia crassiceps TaxID=6207 RepID=A0ABR4QBF6_9CEST
MVFTVDETLPVASPESGLNGALRQMLAFFGCWQLLNSIFAAPNSTTYSDGKEDCKALTSSAFSLYHELEGGDSEDPSGAYKLPFASDYPLNSWKDFETVSDS